MYIIILTSVTVLCVATFLLFTLYVIYVYKKRRKHVTIHQRKQLKSKTSVLFVTKSGIYLRKHLTSEQQLLSITNKRNSGNKVKYSITMCDVELKNYQRF